MTFKLSVKNIGPIIELDHSFDSNRNLIFATNGTGKSFLTRGIDILENNNNLIENHFGNSDVSFCQDLISEEATDSKGSLKITFSDSDGACLQLNKLTAAVEVENSERIFHVFSSDYVQRELYEEDFRFDNNISHTIDIATIGAENKDVKNLKASISEMRGTRDNLITSLRASFNEALAELISDFKIRRNLGAFQEINFSTDEVNKGFCKSIEHDTSDPETTYAELKRDNQKLKDFPYDEHQLPKTVQHNHTTFDVDGLALLLGKSIDLEEYSEKFKAYVNQNSDFINRGVALYESNTENCPFCQTPLDSDSLNIVNKYIAFVKGEENKLRLALNQAIESIDNDLKRIDHLKKEIETNSLKFDSLKTYIPSLSNQTLPSFDFSSDPMLASYEHLKLLIQTKIENLSGELLYEDDLTSFKQNSESFFHKLSDFLTNFNRPIYDMTQFALNSGKERRLLHGKACSITKPLFLKKNIDDLSKLANLKHDISKDSEKLEKLERENSNKANARERVADTFIKLLDIIFGDYYRLNKDDFTLYRNRTQIQRSPSKTLSDGEKRIIAFCYYLAQCHLKVQSNKDYKKLYLIIDDPVSSVSFNYIYGVLEVLKQFRLSSDQKDLVLSLNGPTLDTLLFTHNDYLFNICLNNNIFKNSSGKSRIHQLVRGVYKHEIIDQNALITPHESHLKHVYEIANDMEEPTYHSPNSMRFILESVWRFCRPDLANLTDFINMVQNEMGGQIRSVLLHNLSHGGTHYSENYMSTDVKEAAKEVLKVVEKYAQGQVQRLSA